MEDDLEDDGRHVVYTIIEHTSGPFPLSTGWPIKWVTLDELREMFPDAPADSGGDR